MIQVFGIPNCDSVKKARLWLDNAGLAYSFHDFKKHGMPEQHVRNWVARLGWEPLINRRGPTWRKLDATTQAAVVDAASALACMQQHSSIVKRPVIEWPDGTVTVGFAPQQWPAGLSHSAG